MRLIFLFFLYFTLAFPQSVGVGRYISIIPPGLFAVSGLGANTIYIDANGEETALKYYPPSTSAITDIDLCLDVTYDTGSPDLAIRVESDSNDAPSGTTLGAATSSFTQAADGFTGLKTLGTNTGALTINVPVWIILYRTGGTNLSATNYVGFRGSNEGAPSGGLGRVRLYTSSSWTGTAPTTRVSFVAKHADTTYSGFPLTGSFTSPTEATDIYGNSRHGIRFKSGSQIKLTGLILSPVKTGSPNALVVTVFEGSTSKYSQTIPAASIVTQVITEFKFASPMLLAADTNIYVVLKQDSDGGNDSNDYDSRVVTFDATYISAFLGPDMRFVYGTGDDPTAYTVSSTYFPFLYPTFDDTAADLDQALGGETRAYGVSR